MSTRALPSPEPTLIGAFEAMTRLSKILREARAGKCFIITQRGQPVAELRPVEAKKKSRKSLRGDMAGKIWVADDFCDEIEEMSDHMK